MVIVTEWDQSQKQEVLRTIPNNQDWEEYKNNWKPTWQFTKVLDANLQAHTDILHLVLERKVYPKGSRWIHDMIYTKAKTDALYAEDALKRDLCDITCIWSHGGICHGIYEKYFCINHTRNLAWPMPTQTATLWPGGDPKLIFPDTVYDFAAYKQ